MSRRGPRQGWLGRAGERGATAVEYGVLVAGFAVALIGGIVLLQDGVKTVFVAQAATISDPGPAGSTSAPSTSSAAPTTSSAAPTTSSAAPTPSPTTLPDYPIAQKATIRLNLLPGLPAGATVTEATRVGEGNIGVSSGDYTYTAANGAKKSAVITFTYTLPGAITVSGNTVTIGT